MDAKQFAANTLGFLSRTTLAPSERQAFGAVESVLIQLTKGELVIGKPMQEQSPVPPSAGMDP